MSVLLVKQRIGVSEPYPFLRGGLAVTCAIHLELVSKLIVDFLCVIIEHFSLALTAEAPIRRNQLLLKGGGYFGVKY